ncbi:hypothetical protein [Roseimaritima multifibrata]|nr:hypothetical protein [Roseimaritima multifibrata]
MCILKSELLSNNVLWGIPNPITALSYQDGPGIAKKNAIQGRI